MSSEDAIELQNVISRYTNAVNRREWSELPDLFCEDAIWEAPDIDVHLSGHKAVVEGVPQLVEPTKVLHQLNTPSDISINGDTATARCSIRETGTLGAIRFEALGYYDDVLVRSGTSWKFKHRRFGLIENYGTPISNVGVQS